MAGLAGKFYAVLALAVVLAVAHYVGFIIAVGKLGYEARVEVPLAENATSGLVAYTPGSLKVCLEASRVEGLEVNVTIVARGVVEASVLAPGECVSSRIESPGAVVVLYRVLEAPPLFSQGRGSRAWLVVETG